MELVVLDQPSTIDADSDDETNDDSSSTNSLDTHETPSVIRIAAKAAVLLLDKYLDLIWDCNIYSIAIGIFLFIFLI